MSTVTAAPRLTREELARIAALRAEYVELRGRLRAAHDRAQSRFPSRSTKLFMEMGKVLAMSRDPFSPAENPSFIPDQRHIAALRHAIGVFEQFAELPDAAIRPALEHFSAVMPATRRPAPVPPAPVQVSDAERRRQAAIGTLTALHRSGVEVTLRPDGTLLLKPSCLVPERMRAELTERKPEIIQVLRDREEANGVVI